MKYIITESQLDTFKNYLNTTFDMLFEIDEMMYSPSDENNDKWDFYTIKSGDKQMIFSWFDDEEEPIVKIYGGIGAELDDEFGDVWHEPFKSWFNDNFGKFVGYMKY